MLQQLDAHMILDGLSALAIVGGAWVGMMIKNALGDIKLTQANDKTALLSNQSEVKAALLRNQSEVKEELVRKQTEVKEELVKHNTETQQALAVHIAEDLQKFESFGRTMTRMDTTLTAMAGRHAGD